MNLHKVYYEDTVGVLNKEGLVGIDSLEINPLLKKAFKHFYGLDFRLSPPQQWAINNKIYSSKSDFLISAPTNSGKTFIALCRMFSAALDRSRRSVYVVPLKALADEKAEELRSIASLIKEQGGPKIKISITTGDYQLTKDFLGSPPKFGEIIVCTPERLDVILRNPDNQSWAKTVDSFVIDEFHFLLFSSPSLQYIYFYFRQIQFVLIIEEIDSYLLNTLNLFHIYETNFLYNQLNQ